MEEITVNLHNHSNMSDGSGTFYEIAQAGLDAGIDVIVTTDHNIYIQDNDKYYYRDGKRVLLLTGEEIHNPKNPHQNHLLILNYGKEASSRSSDLQNLIDDVNKTQSISILAHPFDLGLSLLREPSIPWTNWEIKNFTGLEIFNLSSEFKTQSHNIFQIVKNALDQKSFPVGPDENSIIKWDELLCKGIAVNAYSASDAHQKFRKIGPFRLITFPYAFHFSALNNHLYVPEKLSGNLLKDKELIYNSLRIGRSFVGFDLVAPTTGFRFFAEGENRKAWPGERMSIRNGVTIKIDIPQESICRLIHNGNVVRQWEKIKSVPVNITETGYYRVECYLPYRHKLRGWIYSNPIYLLKG